MGLDGVRKHPAMYLGALEARGTFQLCKEIADNGLDELKEFGKDSRLLISISGDSVTVADNGRGIPIDLHPKTKLTGVETVMTMLHAGAKSGAKTAYGKDTIGVHGVGASVVNALSSTFQVWTFRDRTWWTIKFAKGKTVSKLARGKPPVTWAKGTVVCYEPDKTIMPEPLDVEMVKAWCDINRYFASVPIRLMIGTTTHIVKTLDYAPRPPEALLKKRIAEAGGVAVSPVFHLVAPGVKLVAAWTGLTDSHVFSSVSGSPTAGGTHVKGLEQAVAEAFATVVKKLDGTDPMVGLVVAMDISVDQPSFAGQAKTRLETKAARQLVKDAVQPALVKWLQANKDATASIVEHARAITKMNDDIANRKTLAKDSRQTQGGRVSLPKGFVSARSYPPDRRELYIVEGESAGGCYCASTRIQLINGKTKTLKQLVDDRAAGIINYGYAHCNKTGVHVVPIYQPRLVKYTRLLTEVTLDNGYKLTCTRDHKWKLRDGTYLAAEKLRPGTSLMPHYERVVDSERGGRRQVWHPFPADINGRGIQTDTYKGRYHRGKWEHVYSLVAKDIPRLAKQKAIFDKASIITNTHHCDFNTINDHPSNLLVMAEKKHRALHARLTSAFAGFKSGEDNWHAIKMRTDPIYRKRMIKVLRYAADEHWSDQSNRDTQALRAEKQMQIPGMRDKISQSVKDWWTDARRAKQAKRTKKQSRDPEYQAKRRAALKSTRHRKFIEIAEACRPLNFKTFHEEMHAWMSANGFEREPFKKGLVAWREFFDSFSELQELLRRQSSAVSNHKVVRVRNITTRKPVPVYDASISKYHNYALAAGVYVHNTAKDARMPWQEVLKLRGKLPNITREPGKVLTNDAIRNIVCVTGYDPRSPTKRLNVGKIIILADADDDGQHIEVLLLNILVVLMPEAFAQGRIYIVKSPLFEAMSKGKQVHGNTIQAMEKAHGKISHVHRMKGWGSCGAPLLHEVAMNPDSRQLAQILSPTVRDRGEFDELMGKNTEARKDLMGLG